jgi:hypothetical protein
MRALARSPANAPARADEEKKTEILNQVNKTQVQGRNININILHTAIGACGGGRKMIDREPDQEVHHLHKS